MSYRQEVMGPFGKVTYTLLPQEVYMLDGVVIRSSTAPRRGVKPSAGAIIGRKIFDLKRNLLEERQGRR